MFNRFMLLVLLACIFTALPAAADSWMTVYDLNGDVYQQVIATEATKAANGSGFVYIIPFVDIDDSQFNSYTTLYAGSDPTAISDVFGLYDIGGISYLSFSSDFVGDQEDFYFLGMPLNANNFLNQGQPFVATQYLSPEMQREGYTAWYQSSPVPEPGSLILLGTGIMGVALYFRRKK